MPDSPTPFCLPLDGGPGGDHCALLGEDGDYRTATSMFIPNFTSSLATDSLTGLSWQVFDGGTPTADTVAAAEGICTGLGLELPTAIELISLLDLGQPQGHPLIQPIPGETLVSAPYWTITQICNASTPSAVQLSFENAQFSYASSLVSAPAWVRCVQPLGTTSMPQYTPVDAGPLGNSVVVFHDQLTSFDWALPTAVWGSPVANTWFGALDSCNALRNDDCTDWRLASYKELATLLPLGESPAMWGDAGAIFEAWTSSVFDTDAGATVPDLLYFQRLPASDYEPGLILNNGSYFTQAQTFCVRGP
jgi:hypothetical protein